jgi:hypothetical protein
MASRSTVVGARKYHTENGGTNRATHGNRRSYPVRHEIVNRCKRQALNGTDRPPGFAIPNWATRYGNRPRKSRTEGHGRARSTRRADLPSAERPVGVDRRGRRRRAVERVADPRGSRAGRSVTVLRAAPAPRGARRRATRWVRPSRHGRGTARRAQAAPAVLRPESARARTKCTRPGPSILPDSADSPSSD